MRKLSRMGLLVIWTIASLMILHAQDKDDKKKGLSLEPGRSMQLKTDEGTWISLDVSPDGKTIAFDLMGDIYLLPIEGGKAKRITAGLDFDSHPKFSPDGTQIAFISDRTGNENVWISNLEGRDSTQVTKESTAYLQLAEWTPDGNYLIVAKGRRNLKLHMHHKKGGNGIQLIKEPESLKAIEPAFGPEERYLWFSRRNGDWQYNAQLPQYQLAVYDRETGEVIPKSARYGSAFSPTLSPDGKWLVYGTRYNTETGLVKRELATGKEDWLAYPVQRDDQESRARMGVYPAMSFTPDSKSLVVSYGGKIHKIGMEDGSNELIPFEVDEKLDLGPGVFFTYPIKDDKEMIATQIRDAVLSPDESKLAFTALNRLYLMDYPNGTPTRLTSANYTEAMPVWSPDGKEIAYVTWEGKEGHIKKIVASTGSTPTTLTEKPGIYSHLAWDDKTDRIVCLTGPAQNYEVTFGPRAFGATSYISWLPAEGGELTRIRDASGRRNPHFVTGDDRIYLYKPGHGLVSMRWDGTDEKEHVKITGITTFPALNLDEGHPDHGLFFNFPAEPKPKPSEAEIIKMAPEGDQAMAKINNDIYIVTVPMVGKEVPTINVSKPEAAAFPAQKLTELGGEFPQWNADAKRVYWSLGNAFFSYDFAEAERVEEELKAKKEAEAKEKDKKKKNKKKDTEEEKEDEGYKAHEIRVQAKVTKDIPEGKVLLTGARLITMKGDEVIEKGDVLIENARITAIGASGSLEVPQGTRTMDMSGKTIVPGFVDTHAHMWPNWDVHKNQLPMYAANLAYGVTTTRDPQTATTDVLTYSDMVEEGSLLGPRVYSTGPGVGFWSYRIESLDHARRVLKQYSEYYNTKTIKMYMTGNRQHRQWIIEAAKEQNLMPTTEGALDFKLNMTQVQDGYPGHEHAFPIYPIYKDVLQLMVETQTAYTPTMLVAYGGPFAENYFYSRENPQNDPKLNRFTPKEELDAKTRRRERWFMDEEHIFSRHGEFVKALVEAGGISGVGSHGQLQGLGYHWELWAMQAGGLSEHNALKAATILGAKAIGLYKDLGSLESGKLADLVILDKNPLENIRNTNTVSYVMKNGRLYKGDSLDEVYPREIEAPEFIWMGGIPTGLPSVGK